MTNKLPALAFVLLAVSASSHAMGLRSFVALPVDKGGTVLRFVVERNQDADTNQAIAEAAYGLSARQTLIVGIPYRLSPAGSDRLGDLGLLYRHTVWQQDFPGGTRRLAVLGGAILPTESGRDAALQAGFVSTYFTGRHEWDFDILYEAGVQDRHDAGRYDISWQYRLAPAQRPAWGIGSEWNSVLELNGRWTQGNAIVHQVTLGLQWIHPRWVLEGGVVKDLNGPNDTRYLVSTRFHF